jgi:hypothetical protein
MGVNLVSDIKRLRVFENGVLRRIFGPRRAEMMGSCRKLHNEELHKLYSSPSKIRMIKSGRMRWAGHVVRMAEVIGGKPEGKRPLGRSRSLSRWILERQN